MNVRRSASQPALGRAKISSRTDFISLANIGVGDDNIKRLTDHDIFYATRLALGVAVFLTTLDIQVDDPSVYRSRRRQFQNSLPPGSAATPFIKLQNSEFGIFGQTTATARKTSIFPILFVKARNLIPTTN